MRAAVAAEQQWGSNSGSHKSSSSSDRGELAAAARDRGRRRHRLTEGAPPLALSASLSQLALRAAHAPPSPALPPVLHPRPPMLHPRSPILHPRPCCNFTRPCFTLDRPPPVLYPRRPCYDGIIIGHPPAHAPLSKALCFLPCSYLAHSPSL